MEEGSLPTSLENYLFSNNRQIIKSECGGSFGCLSHLFVLGLNVNYRKLNSRGAKPLTDPSVTFNDQLFRCRLPLSFARRLGNIRNVLQNTEYASQMKSQISGLINNLNFIQGILYNVNASQYFQKSESLDFYQNQSGNFKHHLTGKYTNVDVGKLRNSSSTASLLRLQYCVAIG